MTAAMSNRTRATIVIVTLALGAQAATAADSVAPANTDATFGNRTDKPDGSAALTIGRRLPTEWESKVGADLSLAAPPPSATSDSLLRGESTEHSSGAIWGNLSSPILRPVGVDTASLEARIDAGSDEGKLGATMSRSVPINPDLSMGLQKIYSVKQSLGGTSAPPLTPRAGTVSIPGVVTAPVSSWSMDETIRVSVDPFGTAVSAGAGSSVADNRWHNKLSVEQTLIGPLKLTTSLEDAGTAAPTKSIYAGFKQNW
jgi:hypothetical protein